MKFKMLTKSFRRLSIRVFHLILLTFAVDGIVEEAFLDFEDISPSPTIFQTDKLPRDSEGTFLPRYMASVGNGHIATTIFTDTVFMNGLYNGFKGHSHRCRIASRNNIQIEKPQMDINLTLSLDVEQGLFLEKFNLNGYQVEHRIFAHRYYHTVIVNQIEVKLSSEEQPSTTLELQLGNVTGPENPDLDLDPERKYESIFNAVTQCGHTKDVEDSRYQTAKSQVCIISSIIPSTLTVSKPTTFTFFTSYAKSMPEAVVDFDLVADLVTEGDHEKILTSHTSRWKELWQTGKIEVEGNLRVAKVINGCLYYFLSSLPITRTTNSPVGEFYGLSPGGLANGAHLNDFQGHVFWDMEIWVFPTILYFYPEAARELLNYRLYRIETARERATETGFEGARFPWESGSTGSEVTPECCPDTSNNQIHITGDIAYAIRQYISATRDLTWLTQVQPDYTTHGFGILREIAQFWVSRMTFDSVARQHDILRVMPPDDDHHEVDNSVYTNVVAAYAIFFAKYAGCLKRSRVDDGAEEEKEDEQIPEIWVEKAQSLKLNYDNRLDYHPEYEGYPVGEFIKQADVVLLGFPLMYPMSPQTRKNDLLLYGNVTRSNGPAMTWAMHAIGFLELDENVEILFEKSFLPNVRLPFYLWTEAQPPTLGAVNFLTGMGGFLQEIVSGFAGLRLYPEKMVFLKPRPLPNSETLRLIGLKYLDNVMDLEIGSKEVILTITRASSQYPLSVQFPDGNMTVINRKIVLPAYPQLERFEVKTNPSKCPLPIDLINGDYQGGGGASSYHFIVAHYGWFIFFTYGSCFIFHNFM